MDLGKYAKELQGLLDLMKRNDLAELEIEGEDHKIRLRKNEPKIAGAPMAFAASEPVIAAAAPSAVPAAAAPAGGADAGGAPPGEAQDDFHVVNSPLVGTFYRSSSPDAEPFVQEGDRVEPDQVLCIVEAMKVMNEIQAGVAGVVKEIVAQNGDAVEFGEALFRIDAD